MSGLPTSWADIELSVVAQVTSGIGFPNEYQGHTSGDLPFFKVSDISHAVLANRGELKTANHYVSHEVAEKLKGKPLAPGSTVFAKIGEAVRLNRRATVTTPCLIDNNVMAVKARDGVDDRYVHQFLRTIDFGESARSTTVPSLRKGDVEELRFPLAPAAEQKRIADKLDTVLTRVDAVNTRLARVGPLLKRFRQSVLAAATSGRLTEDWRLDRRLPAPKAHELGTIIRVSSGQGLTAKQMVSSGGIPVFGGNGITGYHDQANTVEPTLLIGRVGYYCGSVHLTPPIAWVTDNALVVRHDPKIVQKNYLFFALQAIDLRQNDSSTAQPVISGQKIYGLVVVLPSLEEQTEIVRRVETLFAFADRFEARLAQAQTAATRLTPALLAKAFRGELVPQDPNDEPAAELLRRLQAQRAMGAPAAKTGAGRGRGRKAAAAANL